MEHNSTVATELAFALMGTFVVIVLASSSPPSGGQQGNHYILVTVDNVDQELKAADRPYFTGLDPDKAWEGGIESYSKHEKSMIFFSTNPKMTAARITNLPKHGKVHTLEGNRQR